MARSSAKATPASDAEHWDASATARLSQLSVTELHALYEACQMAEGVFLGVSNQPRVKEQLEDFLDNEMVRLSQLRRAVIDSLRARQRPQNSTDAAMWAEIILADAVDESEVLVSVVSAAKPSEAAVVKAVADYETPIYDMLNMAGVLIDRLERNFKRYPDITGSKDLLILRDFERTMFCAYDLLDRLTAFRGRYYREVFGDDDPDGEGGK